ncbi:hypothetical protein ACK56M_20965 [Pseudomonas sp. s4]|uniref:hypothetical protein n=1 Tax=Pseudomonas sp. s4 TaxID=353218 RepID=UPI00398D0FC6
MRVPISPCDLTHSHGFKSIAKKLKANWCGTSPITLAFAQETLAQGFGYSSLYDLQELAKTSKSGQATPSEADVRMGVLAAIKNAIAFDQEPFTDEGSLIKLVNELPIKSLSAYRFRDQLEQASPRSTQGVDARGTDLSHRSDTERPPLLSQEELQRIETVVASSGNLRDVALLACLAGGLRGNECLPIKVSHSSNRGEFFFTTKSDRTFFLRSIAVSDYVMMRGLKAEDFLFPSRSSRDRPMSDLALRKICASWAEKANVRSGSVTPQQIRVASIMFPATSTPRATTAEIRYLQR